MANRNYSDRSNFENDFERRRSGDPGSYGARTYHNQRSGGFESDANMSGYGSNRPTGGFNDRNYSTRKEFQRDNFGRNDYSPNIYDRNNQRQGRSANNNYRNNDYENNDEWGTRDLYGEVSNTSLSRGYYGQNPDPRGLRQSNMFGARNASTQDYGQSRNHMGKGPKGYKRSDERIRENVCECLAEDPSVDASDIDVSVKDGIVTLSGTVENRRVKRYAEDAIEFLRGVKDVRNELSVSQNQQSEPTERFSSSDRH